jgi:hypothetical protein
MTDFDTYTCEVCGDDFKAYPDAEAATRDYCSPVCQNDGQGLA